jgi:hypothetical protein
MTVKSSIGFFAFAICALAALCSTPSLAQQVKAGDLVIDHAWTRATPPVGPTSALAILRLRTKA